MNCEILTYSDNVKWNPTYKKIAVKRNIGITVFSPSDKLTCIAINGKTRNEKQQKKVFINLIKKSGKDDLMSLLLMFKQCASINVFTNIKGVEIVKKTPVIIAMIALISVM